ncbi:hypothetical protein L0F63_003767 [Massospora cicadina]|nr:hypothetical protein L0F63_003767 [Massospora cicadina]
MGNSNLASSWEDFAHESEYNVYRTINISLNIASLVAALAAFAVAMAICTLSRVSKRVSFKVVMALTLSDAGIALAQLVSLFQDEGVLCTLSTYFFIMFTLTSQFLTVCIALHLHLVVVLEATLPPWVEVAYFVASGGLASVIATLPVTFGRIGYDRAANSCWFVDEKDSMTLVWQLISLYFWVFLAIFYCTLVFLLLLFSIIRKEFHHATLPPKQVRLIIFRVALYPVVPILTMSANFIATLLVAATGEGNYYFSVIAMVALSSQGLLNALIFCFDPVVRAAAHHARLSFERVRFNSLARTPNSASSPPKSNPTPVRHFLLTHHRKLLDYSQLLNKPNQTNTPLTLSTIPTLSALTIPPLAPSNDNWLESI